MPLAIPDRKWDHVALDFITGLPEEDGMNTICTVVDKATKMCHFIPCTDKITAKETAKLYWQHVGRLHGIPRVIISDRDPRFTGKYWCELWRLLGTNLRMGSRYHPQSSGGKIQSIVGANITVCNTSEWWLKKMDKHVSAH